MKKQILSIIIGTIVLTFLFGTLRAQTVTLTFTGKDANNQYVQLNRVVITNLTKGWQETIYWPDTTLTMQNTTGIGESVANGGFILSQNNPNPFSGTTDVNLTVADAGAVTLEIVDGNGRIVETWCTASLQPGTNQFRVSLSAAGTYILTARQNGKTSSIKMVCNGAGNGNRIEYIGMVQTITFVLKSTTINPFNFGDMMEYVGYATINGTEYESARISQTQGASQTFGLVFAAVQQTIPTVTTNPVTNIGATSATVGGMVTSDGGENVFDRGVCYSTTSLPTISDNCIHIGQGTGSFSDTLTGLLQETTYYVRAYAINSIGVAYGQEESFVATDFQTICGTPFTRQIVDGGFESCWYSQEMTYETYLEYNSSVFYTLNQFHSLLDSPSMMLTTSPITAYRDGNAHSGNYCMKLVTGLLSDGNGQILIPGAMATLDENFVYQFHSSPDGINVKRPYTEKPTAIRGYYKYTPVNGDACSISVKLYNGDVVIAEGYFVESNPVDSWTAFNIPITGTNYTYTTPTHISIIFSASAEYDFNDITQCQGQEGSTLWIDDIELVFPY